MYFLLILGMVFCFIGALVGTDSKEGQAVGGFGFFLVFVMLCVYSLNSLL